MSIKATRPKSNFKPAPDGQHNSVCCDVVKMENVKCTYKDEVSYKDKIRVVFQVEETDADNEDKRYIVTGWFVLSMHPKANLRKFMESWRGKPYKDDDEAWDAEFEDMYGAPALIQVVHNVTRDATYANIDSIMKLPKGMKKISPDSDYIRFKDRPDEDAPAPAKDTSYDEAPEGLEDDSDLPF